MYTLACCETRLALHSSHNNNADSAPLCTPYNLTWMHGIHAPTLGAYNAMQCAPSSLCPIANPHLREPCLTTFCWCNFSIAFRMEFNFCILYRRALCVGVCVCVCVYDGEAMRIHDMEKCSVWVCVCVCLRQQIPGAWMEMFTDVERQTRPFAAQNVLKFTAHN